MKFGVRRSAFSACVVLLLAAVTAAAPAQEKPFKISGEGVGPQGFPLPGGEPRPHWVVGNATHLGRHAGEGTVGTDLELTEFNLEAGRIRGTFGSGVPFVFTGANGDELVCHYGRTEFGAEVPGTFELTILDVLEGGYLVVEAHWVAEFVPQPGLSTGKFAGVTGGWMMDAYSEPFVLGDTQPVGYSWAGEGRLAFPKKVKK